MRFGSRTYIFMIWLGYYMLKNRLGPIWSHKILKIHPLSIQGEIPQFWLFYHESSYFCSVTTVIKINIVMKKVASKKKMLLLIRKVLGIVNQRHGAEF